MTTLLSLQKYKCCRCGYSPSGKQRSAAQNNYYWGVCVPTLSEETGYDLNEIHEIIKYKFLSEYRIIKGPKNKMQNVIIGKSTTVLDTKEWEKLMSDIRIWASRDLGIWIPEPNERDYAQTDKEKSYK